MENDHWKPHSILNRLKNVAYDTKKVEEIDIDQISDVPIKKVDTEDEEIYKVDTEVEEIDIDQISDVPIKKESVKNQG